MVDLKTINKKLDMLLKSGDRKPAPLNPSEAAAYLKISKSTLYKRTANREIPHYKPNNQTLYFLLDDLECYAYSNRIETIEGLREKF